MAQSRRRTGAPGERVRRGAMCNAPADPAGAPFFNASFAALTAARSAATFFNASSACPARAVGSHFHVSFRFSYRGCSFRTWGKSQKEHPHHGVLMAVGGGAVTRTRLSRDRLPETTRGRSHRSPTTVRSASPRDRMPVPPVPQPPLLQIFKTIASATIYSDRPQPPEGCLFP